MPDTLVIQWARLGDLLHSRPLLDRLKRDYPEDRLWLSYDARYAAIVKRFPEVERGWPVALDSLVAQCRTDALLASALQNFVANEAIEKCFQRVVNLSNHPAAIFLAQLLNANEKYGYGFESGTQWTKLLCADGASDPLTGDRPTHISDIWSSGLALKSDSRVPAILSQREMIAPEKQLAIVCDAGDPARSLTDATIVTIVECARQCGIRNITLIGIQKRALQFANVKDMRGSTSLDQLFDILAACDLVIGPDTGALQLAAALGCSVYGIYLNGAHPDRTGPYSIDARCIIARDQGAAFQSEIVIAVLNWFDKRRNAAVQNNTIVSASFRDGLIRYDKSSETPDNVDRHVDTLTIIMSEYGQVHYADELLADLVKCQLPFGSEIIVVSSGMSAADAAHAGARPGIRAKVSEQSLSFAHANNLGAASAHNHWLLFINDDCQIEPHTFAELWSARRAGTITAPRLIYWDRVLQSRGIFLGDSGIQEIDAETEDDWPPKAPFAVSAAAMLIEKCLFESLGGFDEGFVNGYEDVDLCMRAISNGNSISLAECEVLHYRSSSSGRFESEDGNLHHLNHKWPHLNSAIRSASVQRQSCPLLFMSDAREFEAGPLIRWINSLEQLGLERGRDFEWYDTSASDPSQLSRLLQSAAAVIVYRSFTNAVQREQLLNWSARDSGRLLHDCDDLLLHRFRTDSARAKSREEFETGVRAIMEAADLCIAPTEQLHSLHGIESNRRFVLSSIPLPEHFNESYPVKQDSTVRIGYAGGASHQTDLALVLPMLEELLNEHDDIRFYWWGAHPGPLAQHPSARRGGTWLRNYRKHLARIQSVPVDLWLAPLADTVHNQVRSPLKMFEYLGNNRNALFSNCEPFASTVGHTAKPLLIDNTTHAWREAIECALTKTGHERMRREVLSARSVLYDRVRSLSHHKALIQLLQIPLPTMARQDEMCLA